MEVHYTQWWGKHYYWITKRNTPKGCHYIFVVLTIDGKQYYTQLPDHMDHARRRIDMIVFCARNRSYMRNALLPKYGFKTLPERTEEQLAYKFDKLVFMKKKFKVK